MQHQASVDTTVKGHSCVQDGTSSAARKLVCFYTTRSKRITVATDVLRKFMLLWYGFVIRECRSGGVLRRRGSKIISTWLHFEN